ncbi:MAG: VWA domain-containing protein [Prevotella sp.]|nr:VWA domain-containing protein [Prevotella sp.]
MKNLIKCMAAVVVAAGFAACEEGFIPSNPGPLNPSNPSNPSGTLLPTVDGIPSDSWAIDNPEVTSANVAIPNLNYTVEEVDGMSVIRFNMTGIQDPDDKSSWLKLIGTQVGGGGSGEEGYSSGVIYGGVAGGLNPRVPHGTQTPTTTTTDENIFISIDYKPKGIKVENLNDDDVAVNPNVDIVFLVDNSGSMNEESDAIARDIVKWVNNLSATLNIQVGCVGYDGAITGAMDLTTASALSTYLNRSTGTSRTKGFGGSNASALQDAVAPYATGGGSNYECGVAALRFADEQFTFRTGANRIYVNFTDEPNQPNGHSNYSVNWVKNSLNWPVTKGTIHTVYSGTPTNYAETATQEHPWTLSEITGGTTLYVDPSFSGVTLDDLPVTAALTHSYIISTTNVEDLFDGKEHVVWVTVYTPDGRVQGEKEFKMVFTK